MGATNTKPQTVHIPNPAPFQISRDVVERIEATKRAERLQQQQQEQPVEKVIYCENCRRNANIPTQQPSTHPHVAQSPLAAAAAAAATLQSRANVSPMTAPKPASAVAGQSPPRVSLIQQITPQNKRTSEAEELQFGKTLERINKLFGNPVHWAKEYSHDIDAMKHRLINCYREYRQEPLMCANIAKQYHNFIFNKHFEAILNMKPNKNVDRDGYCDYNEFDIQPDARKNCSNDDVGGSRVFNAKQKKNEDEKERMPN